MKSNWTKLVAIVMAIVMVGGLVYAYDVTDRSETVETPATNDVEVTTEEVSAVKDETVYVLANADGTVKKIIVSDWISNALNASSISDTSELTGITNVKGDESYTMGGDNSCVWDASGNDIYYQGTIEKELPVTMKVTYYLDGKAVSAQDIAGKSGKVTIRYEFENNQYEMVEIDGKQEKIYVPFLMLTGMILDDDHFTNVEVTNGKLINDGTRQIVCGIALPGLQENLGIEKETLNIPNSFEITADAKDFELGITVTVATNEIFNKLADEEIDFSDLDSLKDMLSETGEIGEAVNQVLDGSQALYDGLCTLLEKSEELVTGVKKLAEGAEALKTGADSLSNGAAQIASGAASLEEGIGKVDAGAASLASGAASLASGAKDLSSGLATISANNDTLNAGAKKVFESLLATAQTQITAAGIECPTLTIDNYAKTLDTLIASLDESNVYALCLQEVTKAVEAKRSDVEAGVTAVVRQSVYEQVVLKATGMDVTTYEGAIAAGMINEQTQSMITQAIDGQMATEQVKSTISTNVEAQIQKLISDNMESDAVKAKMVQASEGAKSLAALKASLNEYNTFYLGLQQYTAGVATAATGAATLSAGAAQVSQGAASLSEGTGALANGSGTLTSGAKELSEGAKALASGANELYNGILTFQNGLPALVSGVTDLKDGAGQLSDGLQNFYEEATSMLENYEGDLSVLMTRVQATMDVSHDYQSFAGISDEMSGNVRFIYRTEAVKGN